MSAYSRVPHSEDDVQVIELQVPSSNAEASTSSSSNTAQVVDNEIIETELTPMIIEEIVEGSTSAENENVAEDNFNSGGTRFSILKKIKRKISSSQPNNNQPAALPSSTDGVFSNLSAKPDTLADNEDKNPPPYETAAADAAPPYMDTATMTSGLCGDEMLVEGLPVGNFFGFVWNMLVSMSFQFVGFLLTYLLHTTHAAKNGSRAGLGITLVQYGFYLRGRSLQDEGDYPYDDTDISDKELLARNAWISYILMALGWFIVIRSVTDYIRVKRLESTMRSNPEENV
ncbi:15281_t:CDS:2 [Acaulospora morrowiae]|uniref:15281_t:CDS:1 n=1 Tax=Acaulospora morrowiae TaxID=94023 RepID=A0A9N9BH93_9GLOM|nr:15281_t:CDS:2 [Acaulospora morrowiae]